MSLNYKIFVVFHDELTGSYYQEDLLDKYIFVNVNPKNDLTKLNPKYKVLNQFEFKKFYPLGKWYTESEVIYNVYKNSELYEELDYIGFSQYDIDSTKLNSELLTKSLEIADHINFEPHLFETDYARGVVMDEKRPNRKNGRGLNCYDAMIADYNKFYQTNYKPSDLNGKTINLCSAFILDVNSFKEMMAFIAPLIESGKLDKFDTKHENRIQGGYLERYYAMWIGLKNCNSKVIKLEHLFLESIKGNTFMNKIADKLRKWF